MADFNELRAATALVRAGNLHGTGYLVAPDRVATCAHVVGDATEAVISFEVDGQVRTGSTIKKDSAADCAILALDRPVSGIRPLALAARCTRRAVWEGYGFVKLMRGFGLPLDGVIADADGRDDLGRQSLVLTSDQVGAGLGAPLHGFSGSPVAVQGRVVGHIKRLLSDPEEPTRPTLGVVFATPAAAILALLGTAESPVEGPAVRSISSLVPSLSADEYHAVVSVHAADAQWALRLADRLEAVGFRIFLDRKASEGAFDPNALGKSRGVVVVQSANRRGASWVAEESSFVARRASEDPSFKVISVRLDGAPSHPPVTREIDFSQQLLPQGAPLERLMYELAGQDAPAPRSDAGRINSAAAGIADRMVDDMRAAAAVGPDRIFKLWSQWQQTSIPTAAAALLGAECLIGQGAVDKALLILDAAEDGIRTRQLRALALARLGRRGDAIAILEPLHRNGELDPETAGILAGRYKETWLETGDASWRDAALQLYRDAYRKSGNNYVGINAATLALLAGDLAESRDAARRILIDHNADHWSLAIFGEAYLLLGDLPNAEYCYRMAAAKRRGFHRDIATMRKQARLILGKTQQAKDALDAVLHLPRIVAFVGHRIDAPDRPAPRFPLEKVPAVRRAIREKLHDLGAGFGFCSAADGSDLIFIEELLARGGYVSVFLPFPRDQFEHAAVTEEWTETYDRVLGDPRVDRQVLAGTAPGSDAYSQCNRTLQQAAIRYAADAGDDPVLLAVWNGQGGDGPGGTEDAVRSWVRHGHRVERIDPTQL